MSSHQINWLQHWRLQSGLQPTDVDRLLERSTGRTELYEAVGFLYVPCCDLVKMAESIISQAINFLKFCAVNLSGTEIY